MKYLILFNKKFPYKSGEAFLENEIDEIAVNFDKVIVYPLDVFDKDPLTRDIKAKNVDIRVIYKTNLRARQFLDVLKSPFFFLYSQEINPINKVIEAVFMSSTATNTKKVISDLKGQNFDKNDEVYLYSYWFYVTAAVAFKVREYFDTFGVKTVLFSRAHGFDIYEERRKNNFLPKRRELLNKMDKIYACSNNGKQYLAERYNDFKDKISSSYLGTYDHGIGKSSDRRVLKIVSCSRLSSVKRVDLIIQALKLFRNSEIKLKWTHLGGGELYDSLYEKAKRDLYWMDINMVGNIPNTAVYDYYLNNEVDLFVNVSSSEGLPVSIMEAISFGVPAIATDVGGTGEIVIDGESGILISPDFTIEELANCIERIAIMPSEEYLHLRESTRLLWEKKYQAPLNYAKFVNDFLRLGQ